MKIVAISDTHCRLRKIKVPDGDLLIHAGDLTFQGNIQEISQELRALEKMTTKFTHGIIIICGNHDRLGENNPSLMKQMCLDNGVKYLDHSSIEIEGLKIFGSAYTPFFHNWAFNIYRGELLKEKWSQIPNDTNVLITHGPPMGILDIVSSHNPVENLGCEELYNRIKELTQLKCHIFGHIHDSYGMRIIDNIRFVNASINTEDYKPTNQPIIFEL